MGLSLTQFEQGTPFDGDYLGALAEVQERLARLQLALIVHRRRAMILFEGWEGSGRRAALKLLAASFDPCSVTVHSGHDREFEGGRHWLSSFWASVPRAGETAIYFPSWYRRAVDARARGELADKEWARCFDEINEFEAQQTDHGTLVVKLFFHVSAQVQAARLQQRAADAWWRWTLEHQELAQPARAALLAAWQETFSRSDTRWARWNLVDGGDERAARIAALTAVADALEKHVPADPPVADQNVVRLSRG